MSTTEFENKVRGELVGNCKIIEMKIKSFKTFLAKMAYIPPKED